MNQPHGGLNHHTHRNKITTSVICLMMALVTACGGGAGSGVSGAGDIASPSFLVGTVTSDPYLPPEPTLPADTEVCATLEASKNLYTTPAGALVPEMDPVPSLTGVNGNPVSGSNRVQTSGTWPAETTSNGTVYASAVNKVNPDQGRIQAALDACGQSVWNEVGAAIVAADASAAATQATAAGVSLGANINIAGASAEELKKPAYKPTRYAVKLVANSSGVGNAFISGPINLPSGVTLWIDKGVTLFGSRDITLYSAILNGSSRYYCGNVTSPTTSSSTLKQGSSSNCFPLIGATYTVNSGVVGEGVIDGRGYAELLTSQKYYPMLRADGTCTNTYAAYKRWVANNALSTVALTTGAADPDGTPCDNGGTVVDSQSTARYMSWWDLAWLGNMVNSGSTSAAAQSNSRLMVVDLAKNFTLYKITLSNSPNFHFVPSGVDGLIVWGTKVITPSLAAFASPTGNGNPLYTGETWNADNVKNTDAFDPGSSKAPAYTTLTLGGGITGGSLGTTAGYTSPNTVNSSSGSVYFDGFLKNFFFVYNHVSTGDDNVALKGSNNPDPAKLVKAIDGKRGVMSGLPAGIVIAHNHFYWGHGVSIGSETNAGVTNIKVYDNSFNGGEEGLRIKSDWARGGEVSNVSYTNICMKNMQNALLFTPYYSTKGITNTVSGVITPLVPNFHDISLDGVSISGGSDIVLRGFQATTFNGTEIAQNPLVMKLNNVGTDSPDKTNVFSSDANLAFTGFVNLPVLANSDSRVNVSGNAVQTTKGVEAIVDCSSAFVDFPSPLSPFGSGWVK